MITILSTSGFCGVRTKRTERAKITIWRDISVYWFMVCLVFL